MTTNLVTLDFSAGQTIQMELSDTRGRNTTKTTAPFRYDHHEFEGRLGSGGLMGKLG